MEIRCPKCKYRFEEVIAPYEAEHSCVCPRCGTPFAFTQKTDDDGETSLEKLQGQSVDAASDTVSQQESNRLDKANSNRSDAKADIRAMREKRMKRTINFHDDTYDPYHRHHRLRRQRKNRTFTYFFAIAAAFILCVVFLAKRCSADYDKTLSFDNEALYDVEEQAVDSLNELFQDPKDVPVEAAPKWIQGKWTAHGRGYDIIVYISDDKITEIDKSYQINGTFVCKQQKLVCRFGKNNIFVYTLDSTNHTIDCGNGIIMHKSK